MYLHDKLLTRLLAIAAVMAVGACRDSVAPIAPIHPPPQFSPTILDGAHSGNKAVFFLPPMVSNPNGQPGFGDPVKAGLPVSFKIERLPDVSKQGCTSEVTKVFPTSAVQFQTDHYQADWHTDDSNLLAQCTYRIEVLVGPQIEAFADVDVVTSGNQLKRVDTQEYIPLLDGRTLPIKVRIEQGVSFCQDATCVSTIVPNNTTTLVTTPNGENAAQFPPNWFDPAQVGSDQVIVTIEDITTQATAPGAAGCGLGLTKMVSPDAHCIRLTTEPRVTSTTAEVIVAVCQENHGDLPQLLLKYDVGEAPKFLRNVPAPIVCPEDRISSTTKFGRMVGYASAALSHIGHAVQAVVGPREAQAFDLGVGGAIGIGDGFSVIAAGHPVRMAAMSELEVSATAGQIVDGAPTVQLRFVHRPSENTPIGPNDATVTCTVIGDNGSLVTEGDVPQAQAFHNVETDDDGVYHCPNWRLALGTNTLEVTAANVDDVVIVPGAEGPLAGKVRFIGTGVQSTQFFQAVELQSTRLPVDGGNVSYTLTLGNPTAKPLTNVVLQSHIVQTNGDVSTQRAAGGLVIDCAGTSGLLPAAGCVQQWSAVASNTTAGSGPNFTDGAATLVLELWQGEQLLEQKQIAVTLFYP